MNTAALLVGAVCGAIVAGVAYAISRYTRPILVAGVIVAAVVAYRIVRGSHTAVMPALRTSTPAARDAWARE
jgi:hypothetical protein